MKTKNLFILTIPVFVVLAIYCLFMAVTASHGPVKLSDEEIVYYTEAAKNYLNHEPSPHVSNTNESLRYIQVQNKVTVASNNIFKETLTVNYENGEIVAKVNSPNVNFNNCTLFHLVLGATSLCTALFLIILAIDELRIKCKKANNKAR